MNKKGLSERDICTGFTTPALRQAGWDEMRQIREEVGFTKGRNIVRGTLVTGDQAKRADHICYYEPNVPLALIDGMQQVLDYATTPDVAFVFSSSGDSFVFHGRTGASNLREANLGFDALPSPFDLWALYCAWKDIDAQ